MSGHGETVLLQHLVDTTSLETLAREGLDLDVVPTVELRPVVRWAIDYYHNGGLTQAPSTEAFLAQWKNKLADYEIDIEETPADTIEWAIDDLKGTYANRVGQQFLRDLAKSLHQEEEEPEVGYIAVLSEAADHLIGVTNRLEDHSRVSDARVGLPERLVAYGERERTRGQIQGLRLGFTEIDRFTGGVRPGELAVWAGGPKVGKSWGMAYAAYSHWVQGGVPVLYSLENSIEMMLDRVACIAASVPPRLWLHGECSSIEKERVRDHVERLKDSNHPLLILSPSPDQCTPQHLVRDAQLRDGDALFIDQLSHLKTSDEDLRRPRHEQVANLTRSLRDMIATGRHTLPCLLAHQITREGVKAADKLGHLEMYHLAESAVVERTADWVFGLYQKRDGRENNEAIFQILAARREDIEAWKLNWNVGNGIFFVRGLHIFDEE